MKSECFEDAKQSRDEVMKVWRLDTCENLVDKGEELVFGSFSDYFPVERA